MGATVIVKAQDRVKRIARHLGIITGTVTMSASYATGGDDFDPVSGATYRNIDIRPGSGYVFSFDGANKLKAFRSAGFTPAGSNSAPTVTITGGEAGTVAVGIASDADAAALSKVAATTRTGITGVQAPAFTGTPVAAAALSEVTAGVNLSAISTTFVAYVKL